VRYLERYLDEAVTLDTKQINNEDTAMDKGRIQGSAEQTKGAVKETAGKVFGDKKLETDGDREGCRQSAKRDRRIEGCGAR
jgi:uncharacterized protein YjbJ (UPF0337 family)